MACLSCLESEWSYQDVSFVLAADRRYCRFFKTIAGFAYNVPVVGPYLAKALQVAGDKAGANDRAHKDLPV